MLFRFFHGLEQRQIVAASFIPHWAVGINRRSIFMNQQEDNDMAVKVGSARIDENGNAHGGAAGDQTGKEVSTQSWYAHSKGWVLLRAKGAEAREKIARCMQAACDNMHVGYDQYSRDSLYKEAKQYGFDVSKVTNNVETDCSALVRVCVNYAGITVGSFRTTNQASVLMATGAFDKYTDDEHCKKSTNLLRGDILVTKTQGHTVVVLSDGSNAAKERASRPSTEITLGSRILVNGSEGTDVTAMQKALASLGYDLGPYGIDGDFGEDTEAALRAFQVKAGVKQTGKYDVDTHKALMAAIDSKDGRDIETDAPTVRGRQVVITGDSVNIRKGPSTKYGRITTRSSGTSLEYVATAMNGWYAVVVGNQVGWVSGTYSKSV